MSREDHGPVRDADSSERELLTTQREVNEALVLSSLRAHEEAEKAEAREATLLATAELRERLLGILGHDLRTPLSAMMMGAGLLASRGHLDEADAIIVERLIKSARRMDRMIGQILDFTRVRLGGGMVLDLMPGSDLGQVCQSVAEELALSVSVSVQCSVVGDMTGSWDVDRLAEAISNIARNAAEHAREGTSIAIEAHAEVADVVVAITNEGNPIPADMLPLIFEPFRRAKARDASRTGNLGLGLYIACQVARAHGGTLDVRCADGRTTFTMRVPRRSGQA